MSQVLGIMMRVFAPPQKAVNGTPISIAQLGQSIAGLRIFQVLDGKHQTPARGFEREIGRDLNQVAWPLETYQPHI